jgi:hypothetical protein
LIAQTCCQLASIAVTPASMPIGVTGAGLSVVLP